MAEGNLKNMECNKVVETSQKSPVGKISSKKPLMSNVCRFFATNGWCAYGENCRFNHSIQKETRRRDNATCPRNKDESVSSFENVATHFSINISESTPEKLTAFKIRDISALKRLYPNFCVVEELVYDIDFAPTDPDWPFDIKLIKLRVQFPSRYPSEKLSIKVASPDLLPKILIDHLNVNIEKYLSDSFDDNRTRKSCYALALRSFFKFFDKNLRIYFVEGLKKVRLDVQARDAGITFVPPPKRVNIPAEESEDDENTSDNVKNENSSTDNSDFENKDAEVSEEFASKTGTPANSNTDVELRFGDMELGQNVATAEAKKLSFVVQCLRCKLKEDWMWSSKVNSGDRVCRQCHLTHRLTFQPAKIHQYSSQLGWIKVEGLIPFDLVLLTSEFYVACLNCDTTTSISSLAWGQSETFWCHKCHTKTELKFQGVRFLGGFKTGGGLNDGGGVLTGSTQAKIKKVLKDPVLRPGQPLLDFGACKHYKKSFRWFRFPCCGKLYGCDVCHEENEDHEIKFANRIVCGYCSKEQPYNSNKPCSFCSNYLTNVRTAHWEGGRGCRNTKTMSNNDKQKYRNTNKTISNRAFLLSTKKASSKKHD